RPQALQGLERGRLSQYAMLHTPAHLACGYIGLGTTRTTNARCGARGTGGVEGSIIRVLLCMETRLGTPRLLVGRSMAGGGRKVIRKRENLCKICVNLPD